jgi:P pilus assembly chaperone PapD
MRLLANLFILILILIFQNVQAEISVAPMIVDLGAGFPNNTEIAVKNFDTTNIAYVEVTSYRLKDPRNPSSKKIRIRNPEKDGLVVFPAKLTLLPGQTQYVRIVKTAKDPSSDLVYEIDFIPRVATQLINKNMSQGSAMGIRIIVGYGARVTIRPKKLLPAISAKRIKDELTIKNTGNTQLKIVSCIQEVAGKNKEIPLPAYTLFSGQKITKKLAQLKPVNLSVLVMDKPFKNIYTD